MKYDKGLKIVNCVLLAFIWFQNFLQPIALGNHMTLYRVTDLLAHPVRSIAFWAIMPAAILTILVAAFTKAGREEDSASSGVRKVAFVFVPAYILSLILVMFLSMPYLTVEGDMARMLQEREGTISLTGVNKESRRLTERQTDCIEKYLGIMIRNGYMVMDAGDTNELASSDERVLQLNWQDDPDVGEVLVGYGWMSMDENRYVVKEEAAYMRDLSAAVGMLAGLY